MLNLNGGTAGGQFVRSAVTLSALSQTPVQITNIRGARRQPGLKPQHVSAINLLSEICNAATTGVELESPTITFDPGSIAGGFFSIDIGTAGSITLLLDTLLPLASSLPDRLTVTIRGGTDVRWSPTFDYFHQVKLPLLRAHGLCATATRHRTGYYPNGGGKVTLTIFPSTVSALDLNSRGTLDGANVYSTAAWTLADHSVADRQTTQAQSILAENDIPIRETTTRYTQTDSPGSSICIQLHYENTIVGFDSLGERGKPAETVGEEAASDAVTFTQTTACTDRYLADQLLIFLAQAGGQLTIPLMTDHVRTSVALLREFDYELTIDESPTDTIQVTAQ